MSYLPDVVFNVRMLAPSGSEWAIQMVPAPAWSASLSSFRANSTASVTLAASNPSRRGLIVSNDASGSLFLKYGSGADNTTGSAGGYTYLIPGRQGPNDAADAKEARNWTMVYPIYTGVVTARWEGTVDPDDHCHVTELFG